MQQIIGIVGPIASGKGEVARFLSEEYGFFRTSLSDRIREINVKRNLSNTRETLQNLGDELRRLYGNDILCELTMNLLEDQPKIVIESIRHPDELKFFRDFGNRNTKIIAVDATREKRFKYMLERNLEGDPKTWTEFLIRDTREYLRLNNSSIDINGCIGLADVIVQNNLSINDLRRSLEVSFKEWGIEKLRSKTERI